MPGSSLSRLRPVLQDDDGLQTVSADLVATFDVRALATGNLAATYDIRQLRAADLVASYDGRALAGGNLVSTFDIQARQSALPS